MPSSSACCPLPTTSCLLPSAVCLLPSPCALCLLLCAFFCLLHCAFFCLLPCAFCLLRCAFCPRPLASRREAARVSRRGSPRSGTPDTAAANPNAPRSGAGASHQAAPPAPRRGAALYARDRGGAVSRLPPPTHPGGFAVQDRGQDPMPACSTRRALTRSRLPPRSGESQYAGVTAKRHPRYGRRGSSDGSRRWTRPGSHAATLHDAARRDGCSGVPRLTFWQSPQILKQLYRKDRRNGLDSRSLN